MKTYFNPVTGKTTKFIKFKLGIYNMFINQGTDVTMNNPFVFEINSKHSPEKQVIDKFEEFILSQPWVVIHSNIKRNKFDFDIELANTVFPNIQLNIHYFKELIKRLMENRNLIVIKWSHSINYNSITIIRKDTVSKNGSKIFWKDDEALEGEDFKSKFILRIPSNPSGRFDIPISTFKEIISIYMKYNKVLKFTKQNLLNITKNVKYNKALFTDDDIFCFNAFYNQLSDEEKLLVELI